VCPADTTNRAAPTRMPISFTFDRRPWPRTRRRPLRVKLPRQIAPRGPAQASWSVSRPWATVAREVAIVIRSEAGAGGGAPPGLVMVNDWVSRRGIAYLQSWP
jgi:hypothetical protein